MAKKSKTPYILIAVVMLVMLLSYIGLKLSIDNMQRRVAYLNDSLLVIQNEEIKLMADYQEQADRDSIISWALTRHGLIFNEQEIDSVIINHTELETLKQIFNK
ncbi:MAG: hypothetical protein HUU54_15170 [Ignavibacteriaceae bacterium]|nr:hypothetical protein [Ignavibacteriaceae bacterium]